MSKIRPCAILAASALVLGLTACEEKIEAPYNKGVCWHMAPLPGGKVKFNVLSQNRPNLESCAASLEGMRERFLALGGNQEEVIGAYQGSFLFLGRAGVFTSTSLNGARWPALVRTGDGRLAIPSAVAQ
jgi:hypothetical protein